MNQSKLQTIKISQAIESVGNSRGKNFEGSEFDELVASIKEKGILVPILVRPKKQKGKEFEVVAGNRRFRAATLAGLEEIPAQVQVMSDTEAGEAQIVENLQRADIHPLDEGMACRQLIENTKGYDIAAVAAKIGKSVPYVRQRVLLTDLNEKAQTDLRKGKMLISHALLIARLDDKQQSAALRFIYDFHELPDTDELREWIQKQTFTQLLKNQPWKNDAELAAAVGPCQECPKGTDLFGEKAEGECSDPTCYARKMTAYIELKKKEYQDKKIPLTLVSSTHSGQAQDIGKGVKPSSEYVELEKKDHCDSEHKALIVHGYRDIGKIIRICTDKACKKHNYQSSAYALKPAEKARRKREMEKEKAKKDFEAVEIEKAAKKIAWPLNEKGLDVLFEIVMSRVGMDAMRPFVKRKGWEVERKTNNHSWGPSTFLDYEGAARREAKKMSAKELNVLVFSLLLEHTYESQRKKIMKLI